MVGVGGHCNVGASPSPQGCKGTVEVGRLADVDVVDAVGVCVAIGSAAGAELAGRASAAPRTSTPAAARAERNRRREAIIRW